MQHVDIDLNLLKLWKQILSFAFLCYFWNKNKFECQKEHKEANFRELYFQKNLIVNFVLKWVDVKFF